VCYQLSHNRDTGAPPSTAPSISSSTLSVRSFMLAGSIVSSEVGAAPFSAGLDSGVDGPVSSLGLLKRSLEWSMSGESSLYNRSSSAL
jgi:hypothetical protein